MMKISNGILLIVMVSLVNSCASTFQVGSTWNPKDAPYFDDGIDVVDDPGMLSGQFAFNAEEELSARVNLADLVAVVSIETVQASEDLNDVETRRLGVKVEKVLYGVAPSESMVLISNRNALGFGLLVRHEQQLEGTKVVFVRFFVDENGHTGHHFHLSPNSEAVRGRLSRLIARRKEGVVP